MTRGRVIWAAVLVALLARAIVVPTPFFSDGLSQLAYLSDSGAVSYSFQSDLDLFRFLDPDDPEIEQKMADGALPWRFEDSQRVANFRPLASVLMAVDHQLFGTNSLAAHLHSFLWFLLFVLVAHRLFTRILDRRAALFATLVTIASPATIMAIKWWSARNAALAAVFGAIALTFYLEWQKAGGLRPMCLALVSLALSLLSCEAGLQVFAFMVAAALVQARHNIVRAAKGIAPAVVMVLIYFVARSRLGYGIANNALYVNPTSEPAEFLANVADKWHVAFSGSVFNTVGDSAVSPAPLWVMVPLLAALGFVTAVAVRRAIFDGDHKKTSLWLWLCIGSAAALLPCFASRSTLRPWTFIIPQLGIFALLASIVTTAWSSRASRQSLRLKAVRATAAGLVLLTCVAIPARTHWRTLKGTAQAQEKESADFRYRQFPAAVRGMITPQVKRVVLLQSPKVALPAGILRLWYGLDLPADTTTFTCSDIHAPGRSLTRIAPDTLRLTSTEPLVRANDMFRYDERMPLRDGQRFDLDRVTVTIGELRDWTSPDGDLTLARPHAADFRFNAPLDDATLLLSWTPDGTFAHVPLPPVGQTVRLD